ncbi:dihydrofolate reductase [Ciceribacter lividus]|uniref:Dihydrofolate reductase n=1 Tax=Ciceribacter lividus TaxID=1197950 RepID=A0A6I7HR75_9HYPH|nr:dihydrofolate reductase family protein [Ciceribacter lividus]RCW27193.1 dihydrofolate reductase [Ciceribacter lividus]
MRKLIIWNLMTLDGYFEGKTPWDLGFHELVWGNELRDYSLEIGRQTDLLVFGRKTYEGMAAYWPEATNETEIKEYMNTIAKIAVSRTLTHADWNNTRVVRDPVSELKTLKQQPGKDIFIFGSAELCDSLLKADLIDEIRLCLVPVVLGGGNPHFKPAETPRPFTLLESRPIKTGAVILRYAPVDRA